ncbi:hypothetical protein [Clostridium intestinale]|uniref:GapS4a family protein n=1 Tax=Clostridium intestinale TaxID=36845 RepID=UPI0028E31D0E|nr:hypothetical protein [Clostridium intestinale]
MSGESSKSSGEYGEKIVKELLSIMGWKCPVSNIDIACLLPDKHKIKDSLRTSHGIDNIFQYHCPLRFGIQQNVVISVKNYKNYPSKPISKLKNFLKDLDQSLECFSLDSDWQSNIISTEINDSCNWGVLFWLAYQESDPYEDLIIKIGDFNNTDDLSYEVVFIVDNRKANFIYSSYTFAKILFPNSSIEYYYPTTTYNIQDAGRKNSGLLFPIQYIGSNIIPFKIMSDNDSILLLTSIEAFTQDNLSKLLGLSQNFTTGWATKIIIAFPDYHEQEHINVVNKAKLKFKDKNLSEQVSVKSYSRLNIKSLEEI